MTNRASGGSDPVRQILMQLVHSRDLSPLPYISIPHSLPPPGRKHQATDKGAPTAPIHDVRSPHPKQDRKWNREDQPYNHSPIARVGYKDIRPDLHNSKTVKELWTADHIDFISENEDDPKFPNKKKSTYHLTSPATRSPASYIFLGLLLSQMRFYADNNSAAITRIQLDQYQFPEHPLLLNKANDSSRAPLARYFVRP